MSNKDAHQNLANFDNKLREEYGPLLMGIDDAGRGAWASVLAIGAVILPENCEIIGLNDSKKLSEDKRFALAEIIKSIALAWSVEFIEAPEIDKNGVNWANTQAIKRSYKKCLNQIQKTNVDIFVADNMSYFPFQPAIVIPKGDSSSLSVAAASVLAKTERDLHMIELSKQYPQYGWAESKGYVNETHKEAVRQYGLVSGIHRKSYKISGINKPHQITLVDL